MENYEHENYEHGTVLRLFRLKLTPRDKVYNNLPYSYSGPIVYHIVHFGPLLPRGVKVDL